MSLTRTMPLAVMVCSSLGRGDVLRSSATSRSVRIRTIVGRVPLVLPPPRVRREELLVLRPPRLPPRPNLLRPVGAEKEEERSQPRGCSDFSRSGSEESGPPLRVIVVVVTITLGANQPPRSRERKMGRSAGAEAVMMARLISMAEVTKPTLLEAEFGKMGTPNRP